MNKHYFIALPIPDKIKEHLSAWRVANEASHPFKSWVHYEDYHITLVFLGHIDDHQITKLMEKLQGVKQSMQPFSLTLSHLGTFGLTEKPRVFWAGLEENKQLHALQKTIANLCKQVGISVEKRPYAPHITIARKWKSDQHYLPTNSKLENQLSFEVTKFHLYETHVDCVPKYEIKETWRI